MIKVLQLWNIAGQGGLLARGLEDFDYDSYCIHRKEWDVFDLMVKGKVYDTRAKWFYLKAFLECFKPDIIHFHGLDKFMSLLRLIFPNKPFVLHYHGSVIRGNWDSRERYWKYADRILVSTRDLLEGCPSGVIHLPRVVDEIMCCKVVDYCNWDIDNDSAFHVDRYAVDLAKKYADNNELRLVIQDRDKVKYPHRQFLELMYRYGVYIDVKRDTLRKKLVLPELSLTGLEALYMGMDVIRWDGKVIKDFPNDNITYNVCCRLDDVYKELLK